MWDFHSWHEGFSTVRAKTKGFLLTNGSEGIPWRDGVVLFVHTWDPVEHDPLLPGKRQINWECFIYLFACFLNFLAFARQTGARSFPQVHVELRAQTRLAGLIQIDTRYEGLLIPPADASVQTKKHRKYTTNKKPSLLNSLVFTIFFFFFPSITLFCIQMHIYDRALERNVRGLVNGWDMPSGCITPSSLKTNLLHPPQLSAWLTQLTLCAIF